ncbi:MAG TPA: pitrilysin family protein [Anaerolineae bacterium]|nr:pitrilysin family protein [Anaerolineae bacterium]
MKLKRPAPKRLSSRSKTVSRNGVLKTVLDNGLTVLLKENHNAPVATFWCWYRVGSRHERLGITGISHWVEHMLFKGTKTFPKATVDRLVSREGGVWNGMTWLDFTTYFETLPAAKIDLALQIESDRMVNALFLPREVESERTVIISERQGNENSPRFLLGEALQAVVFMAHGYHHETIGYLSDLKSMTRDDLYAHYRAYYAPNNCVAIGVGAFDAQDMLARIYKSFGRLKPGPALPSMTAVEPEQKGVRRVTVEGDGLTSYLDVAYRTPEARHPDFPALVALDAILAGASSLSMFGGGSTNASSRLYRALVDTELTTEVSGGLAPTHDPYVYAISATVRQGRTLAQVEAALDAELQKMIDQPPTQAEVDKAIRQAKAQFAYGSESVTNQGFWYGFSEMFADYTWFERYLDRLSQVTVEDVHRAAQTYLTKSRCTVGYYAPKAQG